MKPGSQVCIDMTTHNGQGQGYDGPTSVYQSRGAGVQQPRDFVLWSLFNFFFLNFCCLGFGALVCSIRSRDRKVLGDPEGAARYGKKAKCLNITTLILSIVTIIMIFVCVGVLAANMQEQQQQLIQWERSNLPGSFPQH